ncbi:RHS repeat-associated core domain-containing protein [Saccharothrix sp. NPDC042600]|uniref:RHS repeat-associated core domain-containing protein n=1 Tax=Saccharothrix TaxID=2071 RepID=UPI0033DDBAE6|nr:RHS repeat-associated core domain-containing protein [Saccharothrix mutabilis subsp. capreolus]
MPLRRTLSAALSTVLLAGMLTAASHHATSTTARPEDRETAVEGGAVPVKHRPEAPPAADPVVAWPAAGTTDVEVNAAPSGPVSASSAEPGKLRVRVLDEEAAARAEVSGVLFTVDRADSAPAPGKAEVRLDYSGFAEAFGGSYGSRIRLVRLPACAVTTPDRPECRTATPLDSANDVRARAVSAEVAPGAVLAATAGTDSAKGDYKATELAPSATWEVGTQTGDFTWSYPLRVPPVPGGLTPELALHYSSSSIDGRTSATNNQGSLVGDGFDLGPGHVERRYKSCKDDGVPKDDKYDVHPGDQCWGHDNAVLSLGGRSGDLVPLGDGRYKLRKDDGTRVQRVTGTATDTANGDNDNEYWIVTTPDGTRYHFGKNRLRGWTSGKPETQSTWTVPVFGDDSGDPCHKSGFADSWCRQAWRWNLDYVEDPRGNAVAYFYEQEGNRYARNLRAEDDTHYDRGGYLKRVDYGLRSDDLFRATPPARVDFTVAERCLRSGEDCAEGNIGTHPEYWEDVPWDLNCKPDTKCEQDHGAASPTFWTRKRITGITTRVVQPDGAGHRPVDSWTFEHAWGTADVDRQLLLKSIVHTGHAAATPVAMPPVTFSYTQRPNRVDRLGDDVGPFVKNRVGAIHNETGGVVDVNYSGADCSTSDLPAPHTNHRRCFPVYWVKTSGGVDPTLDWFHKYVVTQVVRTDLTGGSPDMVTDYDYSIGRPSWRYADDDGITPEKYKTWSEWRGYDKVRVKAGVTGPAPSQTDHWYFQGMHGDRLDRDGGSKSVSVSDGEGGTHQDHESLRGMEVRKVVYDRAGGVPVARTVTAPWHHQTASRTRPWGTVTANLTGVAQTRTLKQVDSGWRETRSTTKSFHLTTGAPAEVDDQGDVAATGDEKCTTTTFTADGERILARPAQVRVVGRRCGETPELAKDLISDERTFYDGGAFRAAPTAGTVTTLEKAQDATATTVTHVADKRSSFDRYGRAEAETDAAGRTTRTAYTDSHGLTTKVTTTSPPVRSDDPDSAHVKIKELDPAWGEPVRETDAGGKTATLVHDGLGRLVRVWRGGRATTATPDKEFDYLIRAGAIVAIATRTLNKDGGQDVSHVLFDGWLRKRQEQLPGRDGTTRGRLISDTFYNESGEVDRTYEPYYAAGEPKAELFGVADPGQIETQHVYEYDGQGRKTADRLLVGSSDVQEKWRTTFEHGGGWTREVPPAGGTVVTTFTDALDRKTEVREHRAGGYVATTFRYDNRGREAVVTGPGGHVWTTSYDVRGRKVATTAPDKGTTRYEYDVLDRLVATVDARGKRVTVEYDVLGRKTARYDATSSPPVKLAEWTYDTVRKGLQTGTTRFVGGAAYTTQVDFYDALNRPTRKRVVLPTAEGVLAPSGGYVFDTTYHPDGSVKSASSPAAGDLPAENMSFGYDDLGRLVTMQSNLSTYVVGTDHTKTGKVIGKRLSTGGKQLDQTFAYEHGTGRLSKATTVHAGTAGTDRSVHYRYSPAGNVEQITDTSRDGVDNQCFRYDDLRRLVDAWTETGTSCSADAGTATVGGPAPYRATYSYDDSGNRTAESRYGAGPGGGTRTATREYRYAGGPGVDPKFTGHQLAEVTGGESFGYDRAGNTTERRTPAGNQTLVWDAEGELERVTDDKRGETAFLHTADGERLLRRDATGTTLYLPELEVRLAKGTTAPKATRYYQGAMRTGTGVTFLVADHHGTGELAVDAVTGAVSRRRYTPFGQVRGSAGAWPAGNEKGFVGGVVDTSIGLTTLGARSYDPDTGRFVSVDPVVEFGRSQQMNGYNYADNAPTTASDPDGLYPYYTFYPVGYRQFWVRYGGYNMLIRQTLYLVHVAYNIFQSYWTWAVRTQVLARVPVGLHGPFKPGFQPPAQKQVPDLTPKPQPKPKQPEPRKGVLGLCGGGGVSATVLLGAELCVVKDRKGFGLALSFKFGMDTAIGPAASVGATNWPKKNGIEDLNTPPGDWEKAVSVGGEVFGTGLSAEYGYDKHIADPGSMQGARAAGGIQLSPPVSGAATYGKTKAWRLRNPVDVYTEKMMGMVRSFYFMGRG